MCWQFRLLLFKQLDGCFYRSIQLFYTVSIDFPHSWSRLHTFHAWYGNFLSSKNFVRFFAVSLFWNESSFSPFQQLRHFGFDILIDVLGFFTCSSSPFVYCYFGKNSTDCYANMADRLYEINWQHIPIDLQKYFILIIGNMQRPLFYHGFQIFVVNLETFQQVRKKISLFDSAARLIRNSCTHLLYYHWAIICDVKSQKASSHWTKLSQFSFDFPFIRQIFRKIITFYMMFKTFTSE